MTGVTNSVPQKLTNQTSDTESTSVDRQDSSVPEWSRQGLAIPNDRLNQEDQDTENDSGVTGILEALGDGNLSGSSPRRIARKKVQVGLQGMRRKASHQTTTDTILPYRWLIHGPAE